MIRPHNGKCCALIAYEAVNQVAHTEKHWRCKACDGYYRGKSNLVAWLVTLFQVMAIFGVMSCLWLLVPEFVWEASKSVVVCPGLAGVFEGVLLEVNIFLIFVFDTGLGLKRVFLTRLEFGFRLLMRSVVRMISIQVFLAATVLRCALIAYEAVNQVAHTEKHWQRKACDGYYRGKSNLVAWLVTLFQVMAILGVGSSLDTREGATKRTCVKEIRLQ